MLRSDVADVQRDEATGAYVVILKTRAAPARLVRIYIGESEAFAIALRLNRHHPPRPLTHDLLESLLDRLGARVERVHVEDLREGVFLGRIFLRQDARTFEIDARPSDSIALAVGAGAPIYVARSVAERAGVLESETEHGEQPSEPPVLPAAPEEGTRL